MWLPPLWMVERVLGIHFICYINISLGPDEAAFSMDASKSLAWFYNDFALFSAIPVLFLMYTYKDSNLIRNVFFFILSGGVKQRAKNFVDFDLEKCIKMGWVAHI